MIRVRVDVYDWVRLIAIVFVVVGHSVYLNFHTMYGGVDYAVPNYVSSSYHSIFFELDRFIAGWVYGFHMPLFFLLSGAVLSLGEERTLVFFIKSKAKRLLVPFVVCAIFFLLPVRFLSGFYEGRDISQVFQGFFIGQESGHLWFLTALFWSLISFYSLKKLIGCVTDRYIWVLLSAGIISLLISSISFDFFEIRNGLSSVFCVAVGYIFEKCRLRYFTWKTRWVVCGIILLITAEIVNVKTDIMERCFVIATGAFLTYLISVLCSRYLKSWTSSQLWKLVVRNLFIVYLVHDPLNYVILKLYFAKDWLTSSFGCYSYLFLRTFGVFAASIFVGELLRWFKSKVVKCDSV